MYQAYKIPRALYIGENIFVSVHRYDVISFDSLECNHIIPLSNRTSVRIYL